MNSNLVELAENNGNLQVGGIQLAGFRKIGVLLADIVGIRHFSGILHGGETVILVREYSQLLYSIVAFINTEGVQLNGYVQRDVAKLLSPWMDLGWIYVEGIVPISADRSNIQCEIHLFARIEVSTYVNAAINVFGLGFLLQPELSPVDEIFRAMGVEARRRVNGVGPMEPMREIIKSELMAHQKEALGWMVHREDPSQLPPFWEFENGKYVNKLTNSDNGVRFPDPLLGGIYADKMGLGKTLTLLSLIAFDKGHVNDETLKRSSKRLRIESNEGKTTLVICPPSALCTWVSQVREHTHEGSLSVCMYYGKRTRDLEELKKFDIVLTTYRIVGLEASRPDEMNILKRMKWHRIILDEAHVHQDDNSKDTLAVNDLQGERRWAVTGMPMETMDMYALMCFLMFKPLNIKTQWNRYIQGYLALGDERGLLRFALVMDTISLMRREGVVVDLPPKFIETFVLELSNEERELYDEMEEGARNIIQSNFTYEPLMTRFDNAVTLISTLRKICTDVALCRRNFKSLIALPDVEDVSNNPKLLQKLIQWLQDEEKPHCPICLSETKDVVITRCGHVFCRACIVKSLQWGKGCPTCRTLLDYQCDLFALPMEQEEVMASSYKTITSTKVTFLLNHLSKSRDLNPAGKSVVFTQFENMLPLLEKPLKARGFKVVRLDSKKSPITRAKVIEKFNTCGIDGPTVMVASLKASGMGINLPGVSTVYLFEPWWNPFVEDQVIERVHRIGQKEKVEVVRIVVTNTIEEKVLYLQEWKRDRAINNYGQLGSLVGRDLKSDDFRFLMSL